MKLTFLFVLLVCFAAVAQEVTGTVYDDQNVTDPEQALQNGKAVRETIHVPMLVEGSVVIIDVYFPKSQYQDNPTRPWCTD